MNFAPAVIRPEKPIRPRQYWAMAATVPTISSADIWPRVNFSRSTPVAE